MKVRCARWTFVVVGLLLSASTARADPWTFSLDPPDGAILGEAGATIGWGYRVTNESDAFWLVLSGLNADPFVNATPDASLFDFPSIAPGATLTVPYSADLQGLFQLTWDPSAPLGFTNAGLFILSGESWDNDPVLGGSFVSLRIDQSAAYSATVSPSEPSEPTPVPEPGTLLLLACGVAGLLLRKGS
jgi:PEP-CTERM motif-containing protein